VTGCDVDYQALVCSRGRDFLLALYFKIKSGAYQSSSIWVAGLLPRGKV